MEKIEYPCGLTEAAFKKLQAEHGELKLVELYTTNPARPEISVKDYEALGVEGQKEFNEKYAPIKVQALIKKPRLLQLDRYLSTVESKPSTATVTLFKALVVAQDEAFKGDSAQAEELQYYGGRVANEWSSVITGELKNV